MGSERDEYSPPMASNEGRSSVLHWKNRLTYFAVTTLTILSAFVGDFDGFSW